jgi:nitrite reductase/ring-hydroxylating ferredoxin subunit/uncharacterized membrane protein
VRFAFSRRFAGVSIEPVGLPLCWSWVPFAPVVVWVVPRMLNALVGRLEATSRLDGWSDTVRPAISKLVGSGRRRDVLSGRWLGHAFHPAAVIAPLGCWVGAAVADGLGPRSAPVARRLIGVGVLAAGPALASGAADWLDTRRAEQRVGTVHALLNNLSLLAMTASWELRRRGRRRAGMALSGIGLGGVMTAGFLGGHLAYARGVGVSTTAFQSGPDVWTHLVGSDQMSPGVPIDAAIDGVGFVAVADAVPGDREVHVLENRCTHRGGPLADGSVVDGCIECPWHGSRFALSDGRVVAGPASIPQPAYDTRVTAGNVEIRRTEVGGLRSASVRPPA